MTEIAAPDTMKAVRLHDPGEVGSIRFDEVPTPTPGAGEVLVEVHAAAITRNELTWSADRLPAIPPMNCPARWWRWATESRGSSPDRTFMP